MDYTVKQLAELSGVSVRTLHFYDEIGLLKPAYIAENNYRYYQKEQLLLLQQIIFFKELGFELKQIKELLESGDFNILQALQSHKKVIHHRIQRLQTLAKTVEKTIDHLEGTQPMTDKEFYDGYREEKQQDYEKWLIKNYGLKAKKFIAQSHENVKDWQQKEWDAFTKQWDELNREFVDAMKAKLPTDSPEVQTLVKKHYEMINKIYHPTKEVYQGLADLYVHQPGFKNYYDKQHPGLAEFIAQGMKLFAEQLIDE